MSLKVFSFFVAVVDSFVKRYGIRGGEKGWWDPGWGHLALTHVYSAVEIGSAASIREIANVSIFDHRILFQDLV